MKSETRAENDAYTVVYQFVRCMPKINLIYEI